MTDPQETIDPSRSTEEEARALRIQQHLFRFNTGTMSYKEFKKLPNLAQRMYVNKHGRPQHPEEIHGRATVVASRRRAKKQARKSRQRNRR